MHRVVTQGGVNCPGDIKRTCKRDTGKVIFKEIQMRPLGKGGSISRNPAGTRLYVFPFPFASTLNVTLQNDNGQSRTKMHIWDFEICTFPSRLPVGDVAECLGDVMLRSCFVFELIRFVCKHVCYRSACAL